uniref:ABC transporter family G domain-containing protein n=1 Tax=Oryza meridionalis TaxID=40149 RepID=A0A0E0ERV0_9ORYZ
MDEPTSGLDARAAAIVMRTVRNTVDTGRTVVCTIHQPSIDIFDAFDEGVEGVSKIKPGYNLATWMLEVTTLAQEDILGISFGDVYKNSDLYHLIKGISSSVGVAFSVKGVWRAALELRRRSERGAASSAADEDELEAVDDRCSVLRCVPAASFATLADGRCSVLQTTVVTDPALVKAVVAARRGGKGSGDSGAAVRWRD